MKAEYSSSEKIHYIWLGNPPLESFRVGHDVIGPMRVSKAIEGGNDIVFWCLSENIEYYKQRYENFANIKVRSIDDYVKNLDHKDPLQKRVRELFFKILKKTDLTTRDKVNLKNLSSLLILTLESGYFSDTSIEPDPDSSNLQFPPQDEAKIVVMDEYPDECKLQDFECFLMYAPQNSITAKKMLSIFTENLASLAERTPEEIENNLSRYHYECGVAIIGAIMYGQKNNGIDIEDAENNFLGTLADSSVQIKELGLIKHYYHSHRPTNDTGNTKQLSDQSLLQLRNAIKGNNISLVSDLITQDPSLINRVFDNKKVIGEAALHYAICLDRQEIVDILCTNGAQLDAEALYPQLSSSYLTPKTLAQILALTGIEKKLDLFSRTETKSENHSGDFKQRLQDTKKVDMPDVSDRNNRPPV